MTDICTDSIQMADIRLIVYTMADIQADYFQWLTFMLTVLRMTNIRADSIDNGSHSL